MLRNLTRWTGYLLLAAAMAVGVLDGARSLSVSGLDLTSLGTAAMWVAPRQASVMEAIINGPSDTSVLGMTMPGLLSALLALPAGITFFVLGGLCLVLGRPPPPPAVA